MFNFRQKHLQLLQITAKYLAILPKCKTTSAAKNRFSKIYATSLLLIITLLFGISSYGRIRYAFPKMIRSLPILDGIYYLSEYVTNVVTLVTLNYLHSSEIDQFYYILSEINKKFEVINLYKDNDDSIMIAYLFFHIYFIFVVIYDLLYAVIPSGSSGLLFFTFEYFQRYHIQITIMFAYTMLFTIRRRFLWLNKLLVDIAKCDSPILIESVCATLEMKITQYKRVYFDINSKIQIAIHIFSEICDLVDTFNSIFGLVLLSIVVNTIAITLTAINFMIVCIKYNYGSENIDPFAFIGVMICWVMLGSVRLLILLFTPFMFYRMLDLINFSVYIDSTFFLHK